MTMPTAIGFFDSGAGGLSVMRHAIDSVCGIPLVYVADAGYAPYGHLDVDRVIARSRHIARFLLEQGVGGIVVACNTATAAAIDVLREELSIPIIGMEPALKPAAASTRTRHIAVLATPGTFGSARYAKLRSSYGSDVIVHDQVCPHWVEAVEEGDLSNPRVLDLINAGLAPLAPTPIDTYVLGCTHFPFLESAIRHVVGDAVTIIEPGKAVVEQLRRRLNLTGCKPKRSPITAFTSGDVELLNRQFRSLIGIDLSANELPGSGFSEA